MPLSEPMMTYCQLSPYDKSALKSPAKSDHLLRDNDLICSDDIYDIITEQWLVCKGHQWLSVDPIVAA